MSQHWGSLRYECYFSTHQEVLSLEGYEDIIGVVC
jgi:hypothetical protein